MISRRSLLLGIGASLCAPAAVKAGDLNGIVELRRSVRSEYYREMMRGSFFTRAEVRAFENPPYKHVLRALKEMLEDKSNDPLTSPVTAKRLAAYARLRVSEWERGT